MKKIGFIIILFFYPVIAFGKTLVLNGNISSSIVVNQSVEFQTQKKLAFFKYRFALPKDVETKVTSQKIKNLTINYSTPPKKIIDRKDSYGNTFKEVEFENLTNNLQISIKFAVDINSNLKELDTHALFPVKNLPEETKLFLQPTKLVQSENDKIVITAKQLTKNATTLFEAVNSIINFVIDSVKYTYNPPQYDALYTLKTRTGNCQNFAHLAIALLRAAGVPARIVGGISLREQWKVPAGNGATLVQSMGQGGHAWLEVFFPDLGWLMYDPQQTKQFTSTRHIKQTHGLDSNDINDSWQASPTLPKYEENIDAHFENDQISLNLESFEESPKSYLLSNYIRVKKKEPALPITPKQIIEEPIKPVLLKEKIFHFGNMTFPNLVSLYNIDNDKATKIFDKETAEYVTSKDIFAQAFSIDEPLLLQSIALALHKFGGDGAIYLDVLEDEAGKPSLKGFRSDLIFLNNIPRKHGYYWVDFTFSNNNLFLSKGKYWIVLRRSGEAIINWFYIPGNPFGDGDDTRSTAKGWQWEDILNYDFVFKITAERNNK